MRIIAPTKSAIQTLVRETGMGELQARYHLMGVARARDEIRRRRLTAIRSIS